jgi:hypothetical protein
MVPGSVQGWEQLQRNQQQKIHSSMKTSSRLNLPLWLIAAGLALSAQTSLAESATWDLNPPTGDWEFTANWAGPPMTVPNGPFDTATFATNYNGFVYVDSNIEVNGIVFTSGWDGNGSILVDQETGAIFTLTISGVGVTTDPNSTNGAIFGVFGKIVFSNSATADSAEIDIHEVRITGGVSGETEFHDTSTAGSATIYNYGGTSVGGVAW